MKQLLSLCAALFFIVTGSAAQNPVDIDPKHYHFEFENKDVWVMRARVGPHEKVPMHDHIRGGTTIYLTDYHVRVTFPDGKTKEVLRKAGEAIWNGPRRHALENLSDQAYELIDVESKDPTAH